MKRFDKLFEAQMARITKEIIVEKNRAKELDEDLVAGQKAIIPLGTDTKKDVEVKDGTIKKAEVTKIEPEVKADVKTVVAGENDSSDEGLDITEDEKTDVEKDKEEAEAEKEEDDDDFDWMDDDDEEDEDDKDHLYGVKKEETEVVAAVDDKKEDEKKKKDEEDTSHYVKPAKAATPGD